MELKQLRCFAVAAKYQHITRAANELHIAQPAVSGTIKRLETEIGVPLFEKNGRNVELTEEGEVLYKKVKKILDELDSLPEKLRRERSGRETTVKIGVRAASIVMTEAIISYKKRNPDVVIELSRDVDENSDITVTTIMPDMIVPNGAFFAEEEIFVAMSADEAKNYPDGISIIELKDKKLLSVDKSRSFYYICEKYCERAGFFPNIVFECDSTRAIEDLVEAGFGMCFRPAFSWGKLMTENIGLVQIREKCSRKVVISMYNNDKSTVKSDFFAFLSDYFTKLRENSENSV